MRFRQPYRMQLRNPLYAVPCYNFLSDFRGYGSRTQRLLIKSVQVFARTEELRAITRELIALFPRLAAETEMIQ